MKNWRLWLRWSWRDLRKRWLQVLAIGLIIALGTGVFAGLGGQKTWRLNSYDLSYNRLHMYDLKLSLAEGSFVNQDNVLAALDGISGVAHLETRLIVPTLVQAQHADEEVVVRGQLVGVDVSDDGPHINSVYVDEDSGRTLTAADAGRAVAVVEYKFARHYGLQPGDPLRVSGDVALDFVGAGHSPEYFLIIPETGTFLLGEASFAVLFVPLETAQRLAEREGLINDVVFLLAEGADREAVRAEIEQRMADALPATGFKLLNKEDDPVYPALYNDAEGDQWVWNMVALLFLFGAAMGAFNLAGRIVEAQRREIGIGMALGLPRRWIAFRPMLIGAQIAVLGTILGLLIGWLLSQVFATILRDLVPLPYWDLSFYLPGYVRATALGVTLPFLATLIPVWRAVRVAPVDAIRSGYLVAKGGGLSRTIAHLPLPGKSFTQMPLRNVLRSSWRTALTVLGIAIAITVMTFIVGAMDSYTSTLQRADDAYRYMSPDRILVDLNFFYPVTNGEITALASLTDADGKPLFTGSEAALRLGGTLIKGAQEIDTLLELHDMDRALWVPHLLQGALTGEQPGLILSEKAAADLGVTVGDMVTLEHPRREGLFSFRMVQTELPVIGIHDNPIRPLTYMPLQGAALMGLEGVANQVILAPAAGVTREAVKESLLTQPGVASVSSIVEFSEAVESMVSLITQMLAIIEVVVVILAFLIAFNTTSISVDERAREIATMFAFGLPMRTVTRMQMVENVVMGVLGTLLGLAAGWGTLQSMFAMRAEEELPELHLAVTIEPGTVLLAAVLGVIVVGLTPLLSMRRMRRMDIPSTLRVME